MCSELSILESCVSGGKMSLGIPEMLGEKMMIPFLPGVAVTQEEGDSPNGFGEREKARKGNKESIRKSSCA